MLKIFGNTSVKTLMVATASMVVAMSISVQTVYADNQEQEPESTGIEVITPEQSEQPTEIIIPIDTDVSTEEREDAVIEIIEEEADNSLRNDDKEDEVNVEAPQNEAETMPVPSLTTPINHGDYGLFLLRYVLPNPDGSGVNRVLYEDVSAEDKKALENYIAMLADLKISLHNPQELFSYWVNLYNALVIDQILDHYPVKSVQDIPEFFDKIVVNVEGRDLSLNDIQDYLRETFKVPELHYVLSHGAVGGADIHFEALTPTTADQILRRGAYYFISHPRSIYVDRKGKVKVSEIYKTYQDDFVRNDTQSPEEQVLTHIKLYADDNLKSELENVTAIDEYFYDWSLNGWSMKQAQKQEQTSLWQRFLKMIGGNK